MLNYMMVVLKKSHFWFCNQSETNFRSSVYLPKAQGLLK